METENEGRDRTVTDRDLPTNTTQRDVNRQLIDCDQQHSHIKGRSSRTSNMSNNAKNGISTNSSRNIRRNTVSRRSSTTLGQSGNEREYMSRPTVQHQNSDARKDLVRSVRVAVDDDDDDGDDDDDDDDDEVLSTSCDVASIETAQRSEQQMKNVSPRSHGNSSKPPAEEKRKIMFGKIRRYLFDNCWSVLSADVCLRLQSIKDHFHLE